MVLRLYVDGLSQPARAVMLFCRATGIPREEILMKIGRAEHKTEEYKQINPFQKIPAIDHDGFLLTESVAILRYLSREFSVADHWYPKDSRRQARVDEYLAWQHLNTRLHVSRYFASVIAPQMLGINTPSEKLTKRLEGEMQKCVDDIENVFLNRNTFIAGEKISIADLLASAELEQPKVANYDLRKGRPIIEAYLDRVREQLNPHYDEVNAVLHKFQARSKRTDQGSETT